MRAMTLLKFLTKRILAITLSLLFVVAVTFLLMKMLQSDYFAQEELRYGDNIVGKQELERQKGETQKSLFGNERIYVQILLQFKQLITLDFPKSIAAQGGENLTKEMIAAKFPVTLAVVFAGLLFAVAVGVPLGVFAALKRNSWVDYLLMALSSIGMALPPYVLAVLLALFFSVFLRDFPLLSLPSEGFESWRSLIMPGIALGAAPLAMIARFIRASLLETLEREYIITARAKGLNPLQVVLKHALRPSLVPAITIIGPQVGSMLVGSVLVENIFRLQGLGMLFVRSIENRDTPVVISTIFVISALVMFVNLVIDLLYPLIDPRMELE